MPRHNDNTPGNKPTDTTSSFRSTSSGTLYKRPSEIIRNKEVRAVIEKIEIARRHIGQKTDQTSR